MAAVTRIRIVISVALFALTCCSCISVAVLDGWKASAAPTTLKLNAPERAPDHIQLEWTARAELPYSPNQSFDFNPALGDCTTIDVYATSSDQIDPSDPNDLVLSGFERDVVEASTASWTEIEYNPCAVVLVVGSHLGQLEPRLHVSTRFKTVGTVKLVTERNHWWLGLLPLGVVVDAAGTAVLIPIWACLRPGEGNWCIIQVIQSLSDLSR